MMNRLWQLLNEEKWDELMDYCQTISGRKDASEPLKYNQNRFPLHSSILNHAPEQVILSILHAFEDATKYRLNGNSPLHLAIKAHCSFDCIKSIASTFLDGLGVKDGHGRLPLFLAIQQKLGEDIILYLLYSYPSAAMVFSTEDAKYPLDLAIEQNLPYSIVVAFHEVETQHS